MPLALVLGAATVGPATAAGPRAGLTTPQVATANIRNLDGASIGRAVFVQDRKGVVHVVVIARRLPQGLHGLHIHAVGSCVAAGGFATAGSHFNPSGGTHPGHAGDLTNLAVRASGAGVRMTTSTRFTLSAGPLSIFDADGAALVIHAGPDDLATDPTGNSGARIACGVIRRR